MPMVWPPSGAGWEKRDHARGALRSSTPASPPAERKAKRITKSSKPRSVASHPPPGASQDPRSSPFSTRHWAGPCLRHPVRLVPSNSDSGAEPLLRPRLPCAALTDGEPCSSLAAACERGTHAPAVEARARNCLRFGFIPGVSSSYVRGAMAAKSSPRILLGLEYGLRLDLWGGELNV